jgi:Rps23 Pro-64 3,4-dihydroxylase Tpa1-like proline 4-hydroxylase
VGVPVFTVARYLAAILGGINSSISPAGVRPAPFVLVKDFLPADFHDTLLPFAESRRDVFVPSRVGRHAEYKADVRQSLELSGRFDGAERFVTHLMQIPNLLSRLRLPAFRGEVSAVRMRAYLDGHFFRPHIDAEPGAPSANRAYNFVYFFNRVPRPYSGGELLLFDTDPDAMTFDRGRFTRVVPEDNSIVVFPCSFFHSVLAVRCPSGEFADSRFIINGHVSRRASPAGAANATSAS